MSGPDYQGDPDYDVERFFPDPPRAVFSAYQGDPDFDLDLLVPPEPVIATATGVLYPWQHSHWKPFVNADGIQDRGLALRCSIRQSRGIELLTSGLDSVLVEQLQRVECLCSHYECPTPGRRMKVFRVHHRYGRQPAWGPIPSLTVATACPSTGLRKGCSRGRGASSAVHRLRAEIEKVRAEFPGFCGVV